MSNTAEITSYKTEATNITKKLTTLFSVSNFSVYYWEADKESGYSDGETINPYTNFVTGGTDATQSNSSLRSVYRANFVNSNPVGESDGADDYYDAQQTFEATYQTDFAWTVVWKPDFDDTFQWFGAQSSDGNHRVIMGIRDSGELHVNLIYNGVSYGNGRTTYRIIETGSNLWLVITFWFNPSNNKVEIRINRHHLLLSDNDISSLTPADLVLSENTFFHDFNSGGAANGNNYKGYEAARNLIKDPTFQQIKDTEDYYLDKYKYFGALPISKVGEVTDATNLHAPHDVIIDGNYAYISGKGNNNANNDGVFAIIDISDQANPKVTGSITTGQTGGETVHQLNSTYVMHFYEGGVDIIDVSDKSNPVINQSIAVSGVEGNNVVNGADESSGYVFGGNKAGQIDVFDVSTPSNVSHVGSYDSRNNDGVTSPHDLVYANDHIFVPNQNPPDGKDMAIYKVFDSNGDLIPIANWTLRSFYNGDSRFRGANRIHYKNNTIFISNNEGWHNATLDVSNLDTPTLLDAITSYGEAPNGGTFYKTDYWITAGHRGVDILNISNTSDMSFVIDYQDPDTFPGDSSVGNVHDMEIFDTNKLIVTGQEDNKVVIYEILDANF